MPSCTAKARKPWRFLLKAPCIVTADSIKCDSEVEILNPDLHIATLGEGAKLYMEIVLDEGRG